MELKTEWVVYILSYTCSYVASGSEGDQKKDIKDPASK